MRSFSGGTGLRGNGGVAVLDIDGSAKGAINGIKGLGVAVGLGNATCGDLGAGVLGACVIGEGALADGALGAGAPWTIGCGGIVDVGMTDVGGCVGGGAWTCACSRAGCQV